jgi:hypothetical protein
MAITDVSTGGTGCEVGDVFFFPLLVAGPSSIGVTKLALLNSNVTAGTLKFRLGIYEADDDTKAGTLLIDAGTITKDTTATTTPKDSTGSAFTEVTLTAGTLYYVTAMCEATAAANFFAGFVGESGFRTLPQGSEGVVTTDTSDYSHRLVNPYPVLEGVTTGSLPSSFSSSAYPQWDEASGKTPPYVLMFVNTVTA